MKPFFPKRKNSVRIGKYRLQAPTLDRWVSLLLTKIGIWSKTDFEVMKKFLGPGQNAADIGANQGIHSLFMSALLEENGTVFAFEPDPEMFQALRHNLVINDVQNVKSLNLALMDSENIFSWKQGSWNKGQNHISLIDQYLKIQATTLDQALRYTRIDFIKLDVEGAELSVLCGAEQVLSKNPHVVVYFEFWPKGLLRQGKAPKDLLNFFWQRHFNLWKKSNDQWERLTEDTAAGFIRALGRGRHTNLLACRKNLFV